MVRIAAVGSEEAQAAVEAQLRRFYRMPHGRKREFIGQLG